MSGNVLKIPIIIILLSASAARLHAQEANRDTTQGHVSVAKLFSPVYPPLARQARIAGDVQLTLLIRADGSIESTSVESGHPLLKQAALDSAQHSQFTCEQCRQETRNFRMSYTFQLDPPVDCGPTKPEARQEPYPRVTQTQNHITVVDQPVAICDPPALSGKFRSIKCLYLWKCGVHKVISWL